MSGDLGLVLALGTAACAAAVAISYALMADELRAWLPYLSRWLVRSAARQLPPVERERYEEDWLAELAAWQDRPLSGCAKAAHIRWGARRIRCSICGVSARGDRLKRLIDLGGSAGTLLLLAPLLLVTAIAIRLDSPGPVFFRTTRSGRDGERFQMLKFRTMRADSQPPEDARVGIETDPRVTRVGRFLRRSSLNELPLLVNVLRGDMSLVGPTPLIADQTEPSEDDPESSASTVRPGLTGPAQLSAMSRFISPPPGKVLEEDADYARSRTVLLDLRLLFRTVLAVLRSPK